MNAVTVEYLLRAFACQARIDGMKAENDIRTRRGESLAYDGNSFNLEGIELENIANLLHEARQQGHAE